MTFFKKQSQPIRKILWLSAVASLIGVTFLITTSSSAFAAPDFEDVALSGSATSGTVTTLVGASTVNVTSTWGTDGGWSDPHYSSLGEGFFTNVTNPGDNSQWWRNVL